MIIRKQIFLNHVITVLFHLFLIIILGIRLSVYILCQPTETFTITLPLQDGAHEKFQRTSGQIRPRYFTLWRKQLWQIYYIYYHWKVNSFSYEIRLKKIDYYNKNKTMFASIDQSSLGGHPQKKCLIA